MAHGCLYHAGWQATQPDHLSDADDDPGLTFLGIKAVEYHDKYEDHLIPGQLDSRAIRSIRQCRNMAAYDKHKLHLLPGAHVKQVEMFYWIYFAMTGMHALHMIIGVGLLIGDSVIFSMAGRYRSGVSQSG